MFIRTAFAAVTAAAIAALPAAAQQPMPSMAVTYADLDLATDAGQSRLDSRIRAAARTVCGWSGKDLASQRLDTGCRTDAIADASARMSPVIAARSQGVQVASTGGSVLIRAR